MLHTKRDWRAFQLHAPNLFSLRHGPLVQTALRSVGLSKNHTHVVCSLPGGYMAQGSLQLPHHPVLHLDLGQLPDVNPRVSMVPVK